MTRNQQAEKIIEDVGPIARAMGWKMAVGLPHGAEDWNITFFPIDDPHLKTIKPIKCLVDLHLTTAEVSAQVLEVLLREG